MSIGIAARSPSHVQVAHVQGVVFNEPLARLDFLAHQASEHLLSLNGVGEVDAQQLALGRVHCGLEEFLGVHFSQTLESRNLDATLADGLHAAEDVRNGKERRDDGLVALALDQFKERLVLRGVVIDAEALAGKLGDEFGDGLALVVQVGGAGAARRAVLAALGLGVGAEQSGVGGLEFIKRVVGDEVVDGFVVAIADFDEVRRELARQRISGSARTESA